MKKTALVCAMMLSLSLSGLAHENKDNVSVANAKEQNISIEIANSTVVPCELQSENYVAHQHFVNLVSNEVATKICGEKFSTSYFNEQYEKLALLKRCELSLKTVPLPIWNLDKYLELGIKLPYVDLGIDKLEEVKSFLTVDKLGKRKVITISHLYKQNRKLYSLNTSLVSNDDKLFVLTSYDVNDKVFAPEENDKQEDVPEIIKRMQAKEEEKISNVTPAELDAEVRNKIWQEHLNFVKKFKPAKLEIASKK